MYQINNKLERQRNVFKRFSLSFYLKC